MKYFFWQPMVAWRKLAGAVSFWFFVAAILPANDAAVDAERLMADLKSGEFAERQQAMLDLQNAGPEVLPFVLSGIQSADSELRRRSWSILQAFSLSRRPSMREAARNVVRKLRDEREGTYTAAVSSGVERIREAIASQAASELSRLGAVLMPVNGTGPAHNVQVGQGWRGKDEQLALLAELGSVPWLSMENARVTDAALDQIARLQEPTPGITKLYLGSSGLSGAGLEKLSPLVRLQYLSLKQLPVDDKRLLKLPVFPDLQYLGLDGTRIGDEGLKHLAQYARLQVVWLDNTQITDAGLLHLAKLPNLDTIYMPGTQAGGPGLAALRDAPKLKSISLKGVKFRDESLKDLAQIENLESLGLDMTNVTDDQLADLAGLKQLRILWLSGTQVGDQGVEHLKALKSLQILHLNNTQVTREGILELERSLPRCQITIDHSPRVAAPDFLPRAGAPNPQPPHILPSRAAP